MRDVNPEWITLDRFQVDNRFVEVVWLPRPDLVYVQVAAPTLVGLCGPYELLCWVLQPASHAPVFERETTDASWPQANSEAERHLWRRAIQIYKAKVPQQAGSIQERSAPSPVG